ncbi:hypothetical protein KJ632_05145 [Patescibacteria group bacterium]|nr:hypothetical protein [Patescibacteria group bacterium]
MTRKLSQSATDKISKAKTSIESDLSVPKGIDLYEQQVADKLISAATADTENEQILDRNLLTIKKYVKKFAGESTSAEDFAKIQKYSNEVASLLKENPEYEDLRIAFRYAMGVPEDANSSLEASKEIAQNALKDSLNSYPSNKFDYACAILALNSPNQREAFVTNFIEELNPEQISRGTEEEKNRYKDLLARMNLLGALPPSLMKNSLEKIGHKVTEKDMKAYLDSWSEKHDFTEAAKKFIKYRIGSGNYVTQNFNSKTIFGILGQLVGTLTIVANLWASGRAYLKNPLLMLKNEYLWLGTGGVLLGKSLMDEEFVFKFGEKAGEKEKRILNKHKESRWGQLFSEENYAGVNIFAEYLMQHPNKADLKDGNIPLSDYLQYLEKHGKTRDQYKKIYEKLLKMSHEDSKGTKDGFKELSQTFIKLNIQTKGGDKVAEQYKNRLKESGNEST